MRALDVFRQEPGGTTLTLTGSYPAAGLPGQVYRDGDLVADTPSDPKQLVNPSTLIFAYTPVEDPAVYTKVWDGFIKHMEKVTGKKVVFFPVQSNAAEIEDKHLSELRHRSWIRG